MAPKGYVYIKKAVSLLIEGNETVFTCVDRISQQLACIFRIRLDCQDNHG